MRGTPPTFDPVGGDSDLASVRRPKGTRVSNGQAVSGDLLEDWPVRHRLERTPRLKEDSSVAPVGRTIPDVPATRTVSARAWEVPCSQVNELVLEMPHSRSVSSVAFSPTGATVLTGCQDGKASVFETRSGVCLQELQTGGWSVFDVSFLRSRAIITASGDIVRHYDRSTGEVQREFKHTEIVRSVSMSCGGSKLFTGCDDGIVRMFELATGELKSEIPHPGPVNSVHYSPKGRLLATACDDCKGRVFDVSTGDLVYELDPKGGRNWSIGFDPQGDKIALSCRDGSVRLYNADTGEQLPVVLKHRSAVYSHWFAPCGTIAATASADGKARVWDLSTGKARFEFDHGEKNEVKDAAISPCGTLLLTGCIDGSARLFRIGPDPLNKRTLGAWRKWHYCPADGLERRTLVCQEADGPMTRYVLRPGTKLDVEEEVLGTDEIVYLRLAGGKGWVIDGRPEGATLCRKKFELGGSVKMLVAALLVFLAILWRMLYESSGPAAA